MKAARQTDLSKVLIVFKATDDRQNIPNPSTIKNV